MSLPVENTSAAPILQLNKLQGASLENDSQVELDIHDITCLKITGQDSRPDPERKDTLDEKLK